jgi:hypothetical protein
MSKLIALAAVLAGVAAFARKRQGTKTADAALWRDATNSNR